MAWPVAVGLMAVAGNGCGGSDAAVPTVRLSAAASVGPALLVLEPVIEAELGVELQLNVAGSGTLARQVIDGAPADAVVLAHPDWMRALVDARRVGEGDRVALLGNTLVVVGRGGAITLDRLADVSRFPRLAIGDPNAVPAGRYARQALGAAGVWDMVKDRIIPAPDVRAALRYVQVGEVDAAIVYASDLGDSSDLSVLCAIDPAGHAPIVIEAAAVDGSAAGRRLVEWLRGDRAGEAFRGAGFLVP